MYPSPRPAFVFQSVANPCILLLGILISATSAIAQEGKSIQAKNDLSAMKPTFRKIKTNGITLRVAEMGEGPLVVLLHGFPESWYSWRHQLRALADAGYHAVAPDMRGYGGSDKPLQIEAYDIVNLTADVAGLVDALGEEDAILIGHDWGAFVAWSCMLLHPRKFNSLIAMSVPYGGRGNRNPIDQMKAGYGDNFYYMLYFQDEGTAEAEFDAAPREFLSRILLSPDSPREPVELTDPKMSAGGWIPRLGKPKGLPEWLSQKDLDYFVSQFEQSGFRGGINYYRNIGRNWEITQHLADAKITKPVLFIAGEKDIVIRGSQSRLDSMMKRVATDFRGATLIPEIGHWVQQEAPEKTNQAILEFIDQLK